jgi:hypothetical protein
MWAGDIAFMEVMRKAYEILDGEPEKKGQLKRSRRR